MEEALKSARASFRLFAVFLFLAISYLLTTDLGTGVNIIFSKFEKIQEIHAGQSYRRWVESEESELTSFRDEFLNAFSDLMDSKGLTIHREPYRGFSSGLIFDPLREEPNIHDTSVANFFRVLVRIQDRQGGIILFDIDEAIGSVSDHLPNVLTECGAFIRLALEYEIRPGWHHTVTFGEHWVYDGSNAPDELCREDYENYAVKVNVAGHVVPRENLTIRRWLSEEFAISDISKFFTNSELRTFGMIPIANSFADGFDSIRLILDEADRGESNLEFAGVKIAPRFVALMFPLFSSVFFLLLSLQLRYVVRSIGFADTEERNVLRNFPSPIVREDGVSRSVLLFLLVAVPFAVLSYLIFIVQADEIVGSYFGTDALFGGLMISQIATCGFFLVSYARCQIALVDFSQEPSPNSDMD